MFQLDLTSHKSIYEQVIDHIKELIMKDVLPAGSKLPSVRELSKELTINPNTVQKAYRELEREGFVVTRKGLGTFACDKSSLVPDARRIDEIRLQVTENYKALKLLGLSDDDARSVVMGAIENVD